MDATDKAVEATIVSEFLAHRMKVESARKLYHPETGSFLGKWTVEFTPLHPGLV